MESPVMFLMILAMITFETAPAFSQNISASENPLPVGSNVTLYTQATVSTGAWLFGSTMILMIIPGSVIILDDWRDRVAFNSSTNHTSLTITSVQIEDSGVYTLQGVNGFRAHLTLSVQVHISNVTLRAQATDLVEFNDTAVFMCSVGSGSSLSYAWWNGSSVVTAGEGVQLSDGGATLSVRVTRHDGGPFKCNVSNGISNEISNPVQLNINYGPEMPTIMGPKMTAEGHNVTLICNASSNPPSTYKWVFNDSVVAYTSVYITPPFTSDMSGKYTCVANNNITGKTNTAYTMLTAVDVQIEAPMMLAIEGHYYNLTCNVTGSAEHVYWRKNGEFLHEDNRTVFYMGNKTVVFKPVEHTDAGTYQCWAIIDQLHVVSIPYMLRVNFGPQMPHIIGPAFAKNGSLAVFNCSAKSYPPSQFTWWFNDTMVANTSVLTTAPLSFKMSGEYTCMAYNNVTEKNNTASKNLTVTEAIESIITNSTLPINLENFTLTCEVTGPYDKIYWMKDNMYLNMNASASGKNMSYHVENNMLYFTPVTIYNEGIYKCIVTNEDRTCPSPPYELVVNYGPLSVYITGPYSTNGGDRVTLTCSADSRPDCDFYWYIKNQSVILQTGPVITLSANKLTAGTYTCMARNPVTNITMYQTKRVTVGGAAALHVNCRATVMLMCTIALSFYVLFS